MNQVDFKFGSLIRTGPKLVNGGKWDATLDEWVRNSHTNAPLTIHIKVQFVKIDPAGESGTYGDADDEPGHPSKKKIQRWGKGEFELYTKRLVTGAQAFWNGIYWLKTPDRYDGLDWPDDKPTHRCHIYCRFELEQVHTANDAHYTIAVVRAKDGETFRSHSRLYSQYDIRSQSMIPQSTTKFWTHFHEVGHLIGLGHVGTAGHTNVHNDNSATAYGVTKQEMQDVMGRGAIRRAWHARPWQEGAEAFTGIPASEWVVQTRSLYPTTLHSGHHLHR
jgi:hypothetical protein